MLLHMCQLAAMRVQICLYQSRQADRHRSNQEQISPWLARYPQDYVDCMAAICQELFQLEVDSKLYQAPANLQCKSKRSVQILYLSCWGDLNAALVTANF